MKILVVAAHPDDEVLGCGGTVARHALSGDEVQIHILAEGWTSRGEKRYREKYASRLSGLRKSARSAGKTLGASLVTLYDFPDNRLDSVDLLDVVKVVEGIIKEFQPDMVYTHHAGDLNIDHRRVHGAVVTACRPLPGSPVKTVLFFEVPSSTEWQVPGSAQPFLPNWYVDVSATLSLKIKALGEYPSEIRDWPHARSVAAVEHLARWRGSSAGMDAAEAFMLGRNLCYQ
ncbi:MAG: PIG-L deacetylase family protein [Bacillota bacterium]